MTRAGDERQCWARCEQGEAGGGGTGRGELGQPAQQASQGGAGLACGGVIGIGAGRIRPKAARAAISETAHQSLAELVGQPVIAGRHRPDRHTPTRTTAYCWLIAGQGHADIGLPGERPDVAGAGRGGARHRAARAERSIGPATRRTRSQ